MRRGRHVLAIASLLALLLGCTTQVEQPTFTNPFDPANGLGLPVPDSIIVTIGSNLVRLQWGLPAGESADEFAVFRKRVPVGTEVEEERLLSRVTAHRYTDSGVQNDRDYVYRLAAGRRGRFGKRTDDITARPGLFSLVVADGAPRTRDVRVNVSLNGNGAQAVRLSENPDSLGTSWRPVASSVAFTLSAADGDKTIYGTFRLVDGSETLPVSDSIRLDRHAVIRSVGFDGATVRQPGDRIHFQLDAGEADGTASIDVTGLFVALPLFDDGANGDRTARDGVYERDAEIPAGRTVKEAAVTGRFTDEVGNAAAAVDASRTLTTRKAPEAISLFDAVLAEPPNPAAISLRWTQSLDADFSAYRIFRTRSAPVDSSDQLVGSATLANSVEFKDTDVIEGITYFYRVYVATAAGLLRGSNAIQTTVTNLRPPGAVTVDPPDAAASDRLSLRWSRSNDKDFAACRVYRNETGSVSDADSLIAEITDIDRFFLDDTRLGENLEYHYRVYTFDSGELFARSNEVQATTRNLEPAAVTLDAASFVDSTAATLSWSASTAHDFDSYGLYRDVTPSVTTASHLVVTIDDANATSFRDLGLTKSTRYYYRIFVVDDGTNPGPKSAGSNTITFETPPPVTRKQR